MPTKTKKATCCTIFSCQWWICASLVVIALALIVVVIFQVQTYIYDNSATAGQDCTEVKTETVQAVFLSNGQVYFGTITRMNELSMTLEDVYYLQVNQTLQGEGSEVSTNFALQKLGAAEIHGPEDAMVINREHVLYWENLEEDSDIITAMEQYDEQAAAADAVTDVEVEKEADEVEEVEDSEDVEDDE